MHTDVSKPPEYASIAFFLSITTHAINHSKFMFFGFM
jgi:hypothetical protein